MKQVFWFIRKF